MTTSATLRRVRVTGKGGRERVVPVDPAFFTEFSAYLRDERPAACAIPECFVVLRGPTTGGRLTEAGMRRVFRTHRARSGAVRVRPHQLRHSYATELAAAGIDLLVLRELMGHASPETTARYVHLSAATFANEYAAARDARPVSAAVVRLVSLTVQERGLVGTERLPADYHEHVAALVINPDAKRLRRRAAERLTNAHPDLWGWQARPASARLADSNRSHAWPLISWAAVTGRLPIDVDLMLAKRQGDLYSLWASEHPQDVARVMGCAATLGWSASWARQVSVAGLALVCLHAGGKGLGELTDSDITTCLDALAAAPSLTPSLRGHNTARVFSLHQGGYQLRICQQPARMTRARGLSIEQHLTADITQPEIRAVALCHLTLVTTTLRPSTVALRADSLIVFSEYLAVAHPEVRRLPQLTHSHLERFLTHNHQRPGRGRVARDKPVAALVSKRAVVDLRAFFDDLAVWGWADRPPGRLIHPGNIPRLDRPLPRALTPDHDRELMADPNPTES